MIFVTVGTALGFERLVGWIDTWVGEHPEVECFAQIGETTTYPKHIEYAKTIDAHHFQRLCQNADVIAAHAGMGTIIDAMAAGTPIIIAPRRADLLEQRNDHQIATVDHFASRKGIHAARTEQELRALLDRRHKLQGPDPIGADASPELIAGLSGFLQNLEG